MVYVVGIVVVSVQVLRLLVMYGMVDVQVESDVELSRDVSVAFRSRGMCRRLTRS